MQNLEEYLLAVGWLTHFTVLGMENHGPVWDIKRDPLPRMVRALRDTYVEGKYSHFAVMYGGNLIDGYGC